MKITDINGNEITIADLHSAKLHVDEFVAKLQTDELFRQADHSIKTYWLDVKAQLDDLQISTN